MTRKIKIIKNRSDIGAGTRGSDMGIDAIEIAAINKNSDYFNKYEFLDVKTINEAIYTKQQSIFALRIENVLKVCKNVSTDVKKTIQGNYYPIVLSGDHSSALGTISGLKLAHPEKTLGVVWIDAHADIHSPYTTPSGNIHGMPLAAALAYDNLDNKINNLSDSTNKNWEALKNIGNISPKIKPENIIYFGVRDTEKPENFIIETNNIKNYSVAEMRYRGFEKCIQEAINSLENCDHIYISFDVDSMDCDLISRGTGTPVSKGFDQQEVTGIMNSFVSTKKVSCIEIVEINPLLDEKGNVMAETAFEILRDITKTIEVNLSL